MRTIKFRAWDKINKCWLQAVPCIESLLDDPDAAISHHDIDEESSVYFYPHNPLGSTFEDRIIYQQFTELYDMNGKEIYEGDLVCCWGVSYFDGQLILKCGWDKENGRWIFQKSSVAGSNAHCWRELSKVELVGNFFENPELWGQSC